ncbi:MAG TPA: NUDIX hydrolase [Stellaceae bacterium]|nr:NUDIX hydrolase [Stellaceae bacterium]
MGELALTPPDITATGTRIVYQNRWMRVREDAIKRRDGTPGIYSVVEKPDFVTIAAVESGLLHLVEQYRYPIQGRYWELPQGSWQHQPTADPLDVARGELREETGIEADEMIYAGHLFEACGYAAQGYHIFLATGLRRGTPRPEHEEQDLLTRAFPLSEVEAMIVGGVIKDATTVAALGLLRLKRLLRHPGSVRLSRVTMAPAPIARPLPEKRCG